MTLYTSERQHTIQKYADKKETKVTPDSLNGKGIVLHYQQIIKCSKEELVEELKQCWPLLTRLWQKEVEKVGFKMADQVTVIQSFLKSGDVGVCFPHMASLLKILLASPSNTSPLERSYATLRRICTPERNKLKPENIEILYLLSSLKLKVKESSLLYENEVKLLEQ